MRFNFILNIFILLVVGCSKEDAPKACFEIAQNNNEVCWDASCSEGAKLFQMEVQMWPTAPNTSGTTLITGDSIQCFGYGQTGVYKLTLTVTSESGQKNSIFREVVVDSLVEFCFSCNQCNDTIFDIEHCARSFNGTIDIGNLSRGEIGGVDGAENRRFRLINEFECSCSTIESREL